MNCNDRRFVRCNRSVAAFILFLSGFLVQVLQAPAQNLVVIVRGVRDDKGQVGVALYRSEKDFLKTMLQTRKSKAVAGEIRFVFERLPYGDYAISLLHDFNGNEKMDTNAVGIPKEGYGFSNDVMGKFGPPKFEKAKFHFTRTDQTITVTMKYF